MGEVIKEVHQQLPEAFSGFYVLLATVAAKTLSYFLSAIKTILFFSEPDVVHGNAAGKGVE
jgi:hypothetical protein